jgi:signal transduction histidine kinase
VAALALSADSIRLERLIPEADSLIRGIIHFVNGRAGLISMSMELAQLEGAGGGMGRDGFTGEAENALGSLKRVLQRVAALNHYLHQEPVEEIEMVDGEALIESIVLEVCVERRFDPRNVQVEIQSGHRVDAYPGAARTVLRELVDNAVRYGQGPLEVSLGRWGSAVEWTIRDHGPGIDAHEINVLALPFSKGRVRTRSERGEGLGLALACAAARRLSGELVYTPAEGGGSVLQMRWE